MTFSLKKEGSVTFSLKEGSVTFSLKEGSVTFNLKKEGSVTDQCCLKSHSM